MMMKYREAYEYGKACLIKADIEEAALDARLLLEYVCHTDRNHMLLNGDEFIEQEQVHEYEKVISIRSRRIPLQHITGVQEFMGLEFYVNENVLIPRQDTECLVEEMLIDIFDGSKVLDMCTGSGCILISLMKYKNNIQGTAVDISEKALEIAGNNATKHQADIRFIKSNLFEAVKGKFEFIVSNPPYIATEDIEGLMAEVKDHEPLAALDGKEDGLYFYREIIESSPVYLERYGKLYFEIGCNQGSQVQSIMEQKGFKDVKIIKDLTGLDRVVSGTYVEE